MGFSAASVRWSLRNDFKAWVSLWFLGSVLDIVSIFLSDLLDLKFHNRKKDGVEQRTKSKGHLSWPLHVQTATPSKVQANFNVLPLLPGEPRNEHIVPAGGAFSCFYLYRRAFSTYKKRWKGISDCLPNVQKSHQEGKFQMVVETNSTEGTQVLLLCVSNDYCCHVKLCIPCLNAAIRHCAAGGLEDTQSKI